MRQLKKMCRIVPARGLGVSPRLKKVPQDWGIRGFTDIISALCKKSDLELGYNSQVYETAEKRGAGYFLPGVWGCPQDL